MASLAQKHLGRWVETFARSHASITFVETGTYLGDTTAWAAAFFSRVITVELSDYYFEQAKRRFATIKNVRCLQGDSKVVLKGLREELDEPLMAWLDGHYSFGATAGAAHECPLLAELDVLRTFRVTPIVLIDDAQYFSAPPPLPHRASDWPGLMEVFAALRSICPEYYVVMTEDVIVAVPPFAVNSLRQFIAANEKASDGLPKEPPQPRLAQLIATAGRPVRLHLGCGENRLEGYINVDFPASAHNVMKVRPDCEEDIRLLQLPPRSVSEIRLHHVLEHFNRVEALALLIRWQSWLELEGILHVETPDFAGCAQVFTVTDDPTVRSGIVRHLAGDQAAGWAFHLDHWYEERYRSVLGALGFAVIECRCSRWERKPYLANIEVRAKKQEERTLDQQLAVADALLWNSTVHPAEAPTHEIWRAQLRNHFDRVVDGPFVPPVPSQSPASKPALEAVERLLRQMAGASSHPPISEIHGYNARNRDAWVAAKARSTKAGTRLLDVGAGTCPYREQFAHCEYVAHDFVQYEGYHGLEGRYGQIDVVSDILKIPVDSGSFEAILCTEVLEHVPEPIGAIEEMARILSPGGRLLLTAPLGSGLHQQPFHYYGGFTPHWYRWACERCGLEVLEISANGGFFALLGQECARVAWTMDRFRGLYADPESVGHLFGELLPRFLHNLDQPARFDEFTAGYFVEAIKR